MARIWFLLFLADTLGRAADWANPGRPASDPPPSLEEARLGWIATVPQQQLFSLPTNAL
jgi:hypothetical protein